MPPFRYGHAAAADWTQAAAACLTQIGPVPEQANLGFLYASDEFADDLGDLLDWLRSATGVRQWVGSVGIGICATGVEYYEQPALAVMLGEFPPDSFRVFPSLIDSFEGVLPCKNV